MLQPRSQPPQMTEGFGVLQIYMSMLCMASSLQHSPAMEGMTQSVLFALVLRPAPFWERRGSEIDGSCFSMSGFRSVILASSPTGCRDLSGLWRERMCGDSSVLCPVTLEIESVRCPGRFFVTAPAYQEHCLLHLLVTQGPDLGDATRDMFGSCRSFARAEEGAKGSSSHRFYQGEHSETLTSVSYFAVSQADFLVYNRWAKYEMEVQSSTLPHGSSSEMAPRMLKAVRVCLMRDHILIR